MVDIIDVSKFGAYKDVKTLKAELKKSPKYKYLLLGLKRYYSYDAVDYLKLRDAYDFCKLYGPLWIRHEARKLVEEVQFKRL